MSDYGDFKNKEREMEKGATGSSSWFEKMMREELSVKRISLLLPVRAAPVLFPFETEKLSTEPLKKPVMVTWAMAPVAAAKVASATRDFFM